MIALAFLLAAASPAHPARVAVPRGVVVTPSGLRLRTIKAGRGPRPGPQDSVLIDYVGRLTTGKVFDQAKRAPMTVSGTVPGFAEALQLMRKGGSYRVWIPPQLAYGARGAGGGVVPPNATLDFTITLIDVANSAPAAQPQ